MAGLFCFREWILNSMNICWASFSALKNMLVPSVSKWSDIKSSISLREALLLHQNLFWALTLPCTLLGFFVCCFVFFRAAPVAYGGSQVRVESELLLLAYTRATATQDPSRICNLHHSSLPHGSLTHWARPGIRPTSSCILIRFANHWATMGTPTTCTFDRVT